jgi:hypothetical protein
MSRLGQYLEARGFISRDQLEEALSHQTVHGARLGTNLVELGFISVEQLAACLSDFHKAPLPERRWLEKPQRAATQRATRSLVERIRFIPMRLEGKVLHAAVLDPRHPNVLDDLRFATGCRIEPYVLPEIWMHDWVLQLFRVPRGIRHVETRGGFDNQPMAPLVVQRTSNAPAQRVASAARNAPSSRAPSIGINTAPPPSFEDKRPGPSFLPGIPEPTSLFESTAVAHAKATTPAPSRPISGLPPIPSQRPRGPTVPPPFLPPGVRSGASVRPPPVPVPKLSDAPDISIDATSWHWSPPEQSRVPVISIEPDDVLDPPPPSPAATPSSPAGLWSTPPAEPALFDEQPTDVELPALATGPSPLPLTDPADQLQPATAAQTLAQDLSEWESELLSAPNRDQLIESAFRIASCFATNVALFIVQQGMVQGQSSVELGIARPLEGVLIPLDADSAFTQAVRRAEAMRANPQERVIDQRVALILCDEAHEVALFPVMIKQRVVNVLYASNGGAPLGAIAYGALAQLAVKMGAAYEQLILSRKAGTAG